MTEHDLSDQPSTDGKPATDSPVVAGAGETFDALDSDTPLSAGSQQDGGVHAEEHSGTTDGTDPDPG